MSVINVIGKQVDVNIEDELRIYPWDRARWSESKLIACSPFRSDSHPSFFVSLETGGWGDSGAYDEYQSGNLVKLLGYLRGTDVYEASDYLVNKYGALYEIPDDTSGQTTLQVAKPVIVNKSSRLRIIDEDVVVPAVSPYVRERGISDDVQRMFSIGYGKGQYGYTAFPWRTMDGRMATVKYRSTRNKSFFYEPKSTPVGDLIYGLDLTVGVDAIIVTEGEFDALSWWTAGIPSIAVGGSFINRTQLDMISRSGFDTIYVGGDNDKQGERLNEILKKYFRGGVRLYEIDYGSENDANDVLRRHGINSMNRMYAEANQVSSINVKLRH